MSYLKMCWEFFEYLFQVLSTKGAVLITAMTGSFFGALSAYWSERFRERRKKETDQFGAIIRAQVALISQLNAICNLKQQYLETLEGNDKRELQLVMFEITDTAMRVTYESIAFLVDTDANLVHQVHAAEQCYITAVCTLTQRNRAYEKLHENSELQELDSKTGRCRIVLDDPRRLKLLKDYTDALYSAVERAEKKLQSEIAALKTTGKRLFPKKKFLQISN